MIPYPNINPDLVTIGPLHVRWYGLMYVLGFLAGYILVQRQDRSRQLGLVGTTAQDLIFYIAIGLIVGARLGYVVFYDYSQYMTYLTNPWRLLPPGMAECPSMAVFWAQHSPPGGSVAVAGFPSWPSLTV